jgi:hypothetical protein
MTKNFQTLVDRMDAERQSRVKTRAEKELERMTHHEQREAKSNTRSVELPRVNGSRKKSKQTSK